jgi:homoserine kinase
VRVRDPYPEPVHVSAPASSANLGPGFDCLALAVDLPFELATATDAPLDFHDVEPRHPAAVAFAAAGGDPEVGLRWRSPIPPGRGLGFSGAARVAGAHLAGLLDGLDEASARDGAFRIAAELEGHPDNAAASAYGGLTVAAGEQVLSVPVPGDLALFAWSPPTTTSTNSSRATLSAEVPLEDAVFSLGRAALWVAAMSTGDLSVLRTACQDRLHQPARLAARDDSRSVLEHLLGNDSVLAAWLSGSGPTVAALVRSDAAASAAGDDLPVEGQVRVVAITASGVAAIEGSPT